MVAKSVKRATVVVAAHVPVANVAASSSTCIDVIDIHDTVSHTVSCVTHSITYTVKHSLTYVVRYRVTCSVETFS